MLKTVLLHTALLLTPLALLLAADVSKPVSASKPNILIILTDDMGWGDPHCFNPQSKIATPNIDRLAAEGMKFTDAHAGGSICVPSRYSLLSGRMPYRNWNTTGVKGVRKQSKNGREMIHFPQPQLQAEPGRLNLATLMKRQGYATACVGKWHQGMSSKAEADGTLKMSPVDFGFDYYFGFDAPEQGPYAFIENKHFVIAPTETIEDHPGEGVTNPETQGAHWRKGLAAPGWKFEGYLSTIADKADAWLTKQSASGGKEPFFLYYAIPAPHAPWATAGEFKGKSGAGQYGDYVMNVDAMIGQVLATLDKLKLKDNTLIFFSSGNGPVWYPQDIEKFGHHAAGPWNGMKGALTDAGHRMPLIASWPGVTPAGKVNKDLVNFTDMHSTFLELAGAKAPEGLKFDSVSIAPQLRGEKGMPREWAYVQLGPHWYVRNQGWKLNESGELFDMSDAPFVEKLIEPAADTEASKAARARLSAVLTELNPAGGKVDGRKADKPGKKKKKKKQVQE